MIRQKPPLRRRHRIFGAAVRLAVGVATIPVWWVIVLAVYVTMLSKAREDRRRARDGRGVPTPGPRRTRD